MSHNASDKYKLFRNYMTNELGISREDIKAWVCESIATEVGKLIGQINIEERFSQALQTKVNAALGLSRFGEASKELRLILTEQLAKQIAQGLDIDVTVKPKPVNEVNPVNQTTDH
jgi:hypothetical protein